MCCSQLNIYNRGFRINQVSVSPSMITGINKQVTRILLSNTGPTQCIKS